MRSITRQIEDRIERQQRIKRNVRTGSPQVLHFQENSGRVVGDNVTPSRFEWRCDYFSEAKYGQSGVNTAIGDDTITVDNGDTGASGTFDGTDFTYTDGTKSWDIDEWIGYQLVVNGNYYKISSNTATKLTLEILRGAVIQNTSYAIVAFIPNSLGGLSINPDNASDDTYIIESNTTTVITVTRNSIRTWNPRLGPLVTTGDAGAPYDTFRASGMIGYGDDFWNGHVMNFTIGDNASESLVILDYTSATGEFVVDTGFSNSIDVGDRFMILRPLLNVSVGATWRLETGYIPGATDFADNVDSLLRREIGIIGDGAIDDTNFERPFVGRYTVEVLSESTKTFAAAIEFNGAINIEIVNMSSNRRTTLRQAASPAQFISPKTIVFTVEAFTWYRIEIYLYVPLTISGKLRVSGIVPFINSWRDITAGAPTIVSVSGADSSNNNDPATMQENQITIDWSNNSFILNGNTEIHTSDTEGGTFTKLGAANLSVTSGVRSYTPGTTKWVKLRHVSASGVLGPFTPARKGVVAPPGAGNTVIDLIWVDNGGTPIFPNANGWFNDAVLKAKITVTSDLTISAIQFTRTGAGQADLGDTSPATSAAVAESAAGVASVIVEFTNGLSTESQSWLYQYDKTAPTIPVIDSLIAENFEVKAVIASGGVDAVSGFDRWEWYYNFTGAAPNSGTAPLRTSKTNEIVQGYSSVAYGDTVYVWVRSVDNAGNVSAYTSLGNLDLTTTEITSGHEVKDLMEFTG